MGDALLRATLVQESPTADRDVVSRMWGEYHTWPASAAASWMLIRAAQHQLLLVH